MNLLRVSTEKQRFGCLPAAFPSSSMLLVFIVVCSMCWVPTALASCSATAVINFHISTPLTFLAPLTSSQTEPLHSINYASVASAAAAVDMQNAATLQQNTPASGYLPIFNQNISWGGSCFSVNLYPKYSLNLVDYNSDTDFATNAVQSVAQCEHTNTSLPKGVALIHGSQANDDMFDFTSSACNNFNVSTITSILRVKDFNRVTEQPYQLRIGNMPRNTIPEFLHVLQKFSWTRFAVISSVYPPVVDAVNVLSAEAAALNYQLSNYLVAADTSCTAAWDQIVAHDYKVIFFIPTVREASLCLNEFHARNLSAQNFVIVFSDDFLATLLDDWTALAQYINFPLAYFHGHIILNADVNTIAPTQFAPSFIGFLNAYYAAYNVNANIVPVTYIINLLVGETVNLAAQGVLGMFGDRLAGVKQTYNATSTSTGGSTATLVQQLSLDLLGKFSNGFPLQSSAVTFSPSADNVNFDVQVPYGAVGFNLSNIFFWMTNTSGSTTVSILESDLHFDSHGVKLNNVFAGNLNQTKPNYFSYWSNRFQALVPLNVNQFFWPNASLLSTYAHGWPADRNPPTSIQVVCISCSGQASSQSSPSGMMAPTLQPTPAAQAPAGNIIFSGVANLQTVYQLDISIDTPQVFTFQTQCDGTAPLTNSMNPLIQSLSVSTLTGTLTAPVLFNPQTGQIQVSSAQVIAELSLLYSLNPASFSPAFSMPSVTLSQLQSLVGGPSSAAAAAVIGVVDGGNSGFVLNLLLNCDNTANNFSSVIRIVTHGLPNIYTPSTAQQVALVVVNSIGLAVAAFLAVGVVYLRDSQVVFSSSFLFLLIILLGFGLLFISSLLSILTATAAICQAKTICFHFGFTITLGALFSKTYRLHRIFNSRTIQLLIITNKILVGVLSLMVLVDAILLAIWIEASGMDIESGSKPHCFTSGAGNDAFPAIFTGIKGALILCGIYFTVKVRSVPANFNESRFIAIVIYNTAVLGILYVVVFFGTSLQPKDLALFTSVVLFAASFLNMSVFFGSKLWAVGQNYFTSSNSSTGTGTGTPSGSKFMKDNAKTTSLRDNLKVGRSQSRLDLEKKEQEEQDSDKEETEDEKKMDRRQRLRRRVHRERVRFLQTVSFVKQRENERARVVRRTEEIQTALTQSYDNLRALVIKLRLNCMKIQRFLTRVHVGDESKEDKDDQLILMDVDMLLKLPLDELEVEDGGMNYTVIKDGGTGTSTQNSSRRATAAAASGPKSGTGASTINPLTTVTHGGLAGIVTTGGVELGSLPSPKGPSSQHGFPSGRMGIIDESDNRHVRQSMTASTQSTNGPIYHQMTTSTTGGTVNASNGTPNTHNSTLPPGRQNGSVASSNPINASPALGPQNVRVFVDNEGQDPPRPKAFI